MKNRSFGNLIFTSLMKSWGPVIALLGFALTFVSYFAVPTQDTIALNLFLVVLSISFFVLVIFARAAWEANESQSNHQPKIMYVKDPPKAFPDAFALFLVEPTPLFSYDASVSIYYLEDGVEKLVGLGKVINIQNDLKVQILVMTNYDFGEKSDAIKNNSKDELSKLILKSSIPSFLMEDLRNG